MASRRWLVVLCLPLLQAEDCGGNGDQGGSCPADTPLICPHNGGCCRADLPYECTTAADGDVCQNAPFAPGECTNTMDFCSVTGTDPGPSDGYAQCAAFQQAPLYCDTFAGPQLLQGVPGECCSIGAGATSQVGYLCVLDDSSTSGGVCQDMATIAAGCPQTGTLVRCCFGGPC